jgi:hypothetical protein
MANKDMTTLYDLIYKHIIYYQDTIEGNTDPEIIKASYDRWAQYCIITAITPKYLRIDLPQKADAQTVVHYADYKIHKGLWVICGDYGKDVDEYYWCKNRVQSLARKWLCRVRCTGPYLLHIIKI